MKSVMILNGENRGVLGVVRSLGKRGVPVLVGGNRILSRSIYSKYCKKGFVYTSSYHDADQMHETILRNVKKFKPDVLFPFGSDTTYVILKNIDVYKKYCDIIPLLDFKRFCMFNDKETLIKEAVKAGCSIPKTYFPIDLEEVEQLAERLEYPVLIKPRIGSTAKGITKVSSSFELIKHYGVLSNQNNPTLTYDSTRPIIQEFVPNKNTYTVYVLFNKGKHIASMVGENHRHYPLPFGSPISNITVLNEGIRMLAVNLFKKLDWHGPANIHFIMDPRDGVPKMLEINPRLWATVEMSIKAGIDFPYMLYKIALGENVEEMLGYEISQKFRWVLFGEFFYLLKSRGKLETFKDYLNFKTTKTEIDLKDIKPHIVHFLDLLVNKQRL